MVCELLVSLQAKLISLLILYAKLKDLAGFDRSSGQPPIINTID